MGHPNRGTPDDLQVINVDLSVIKADLPAFASEWSKCFIQIYVDGSPNPVRTKPTKRAGQHEWGERFSLPARSETILRFELKRKTLLRQQSLAFAEAPISDLLVHRQQSGGPDQDLSILLRPHLEKENEKGDHWRLLLRLHEIGIIREVLEQRHGESVESSMAEIVVKLEAFMTVGDALAELNPYAKVAWKTVSAFYTIIKGQVDRYARLEDLGSLMRDSYAFVENIKSFPEKLPTLEGTIRTLLSQTVECTMFLRECSGHGFGERVLFSAWTDRQINGFMQSFASLKQSLETGTSIQAALVCFRLDENVNKLLNTQALLKLGPADMDDAARTECLPNTRMDILAEIFAWISIPTTKDNVYWLHGFPGAGKSTIATSVANIFRDLRRLGAFAFFTRGVAARNDPALLIRTLAYQLGEFDHRIGSAIAKVIEDVPSIKQAPLRWQFQKLLVEPFANLKDCLREGPILIVIEALDECGQSAAREELLRVLASASPRLPPTIRIFITSRAERDIRSAFSNQSHIFVREIDIKSPTNEKDVQTYIHHRLVDIRLQNEWLDLPSDWPGKARTEALALRASGLFIWASTACRYIEKGQDPEERLSQLEHASLYGDAEAALDGIYITALESAGRWDDVAFATDFREIMGLIIVAEDPLTAHTIDLLNADVESRRRRPCLHTIRHLGTVLQWGENQPICVMHPSFADFITERRRCGSDAWFIDRPAQHLRIARLCMTRLRKVLKKNMCGLKPFTSGWKVQLPEDVVYPARYWVDHLCNSKTHAEEVLAEEIYSLLHSHFLHWIEVMTMMRKARQTIGLVLRLKEWVDTHYGDHGALREFTKDAVRFCQAYTHVYEQHPLLVYQSALPFTPTATTVFQTFKDDPEIPVVAGGFRERWSPILTEFGRPGGNVASISCSSDGQYIASTNFRNIFIWDSESGELVTKPMQAGKSDFTVIAFSPNNQHVASGSTDGRVKLWDALSGEQVGGALEQHSGPVYALAFSNDANMFVSASKDQTIVVWNANDSSMVHAPLTGHQKAILTLAFSPVGSHFASGSRDRSIRIWDAAIGGAALSNIVHPWGTVTSLAYTPDGNRIISGSDDRTIRVWDAHQGILLYNPVFKGHKSDIFSISISPNGTLLASASKDTSVRLWDISTGTELSHLIRQHRLPVRCVTFSHDGKRIVTGSNDAMVRVWDVESVGSMGTPRLHKGLVTHIAFSADGTRVVSGGLDKTVRVWCAESGRALMDPLRLGREVSTVAFDDDEHGERGGVRILATDKGGTVFAWNMATREPLTASASDHPTLHAREGKLILEGKWIVDKTTNEALSLLPNMSPAKARASHGNKIAIGLANGSIVILHFPLES
ncbi:hypothetical protein JVT61DRAFT_4932 [Boletus reticuloceps]|uniref:Nephrocystin 3-like N-terminal domain-containing protein n=1 Tax=Boletus reticuloceps TaxID=495285 RepID=A0A8I2YWG9_9AGAM|nr:hypothetical protein JVT61DRAFT_4932 [Boletus reticuloceps]